MKPNETKEHLNSCDLAERIRLIGADLTSERDEYRCLDAFELVELLEIPLPPDGIWSLYRKHYIESIDEYVSSRGGTEEIAEEISSVDAASVLAECREEMPISTRSVTDSAYREISRRLTASGSKFLKTLSKDEVDAIRLACAYNDYESARWNGLGARAICSIESADGQIIFDAVIEDDGECIEMDSPYDVRDTSKANEGKAEDAYFEEYA
jgi:hypothetical protein